MELRKDISRFITQICEKNYSSANSTLETLIEKKLKAKVKKMQKDCCKPCANKKKKKVIKEYLDDVDDSTFDPNAEENFSTEEEISNEPESGDIVLQPHGHLGNRTSVSEIDGKHLGIFKSEDEALASVKEYMNDNKYYPKVWIASDHGNFEEVTDLNF